MIKPTMRICTFLLAAGLMIATAGMKAQSVIPTHQPFRYAS